MPTSSAYDSPKELLPKPRRRETWGLIKGPLHGMTIGEVEGFFVVVVSKLAPAFYSPRLSTRPPPCGSEEGWLGTLASLSGWGQQLVFSAELARLGGRRWGASPASPASLGLGLPIGFDVVAVQSCSGLVSGKCLAS